MKGIADIIGLSPTGQFFCVECKIGYNKQSEYQKEFENNIIKNGGIYILAYSFEEVLEKLKI